jgi:bis(5'-nucleosyl)-tetraphosphatase (symmetrical)
MALYLIGDVQGCDGALQQLLNKISFSPSRDTLYLLGDLVNRGPSSAAVLRRLRGYGAAARCLLGNHDLNLLAVAHGVRKPHRKDTLNCILEAPDRTAMLDWLRAQRMAIAETIDGHTVLMVHAGVLPSWTSSKTMSLAAEVEAMLCSPELGNFLREMFDDEPNCWSDALQGTTRLRVIVNVLTRLRFCDIQGKMEFKFKEGAGSAPQGYLPWFDVPNRKTAAMTMAFGHWSTLGWLGRTDVLALDTGCVWGGCLSAIRIAGQGLGNPLTQELIQVKCDMVQKPS